MAENDTSGPPPDPLADATIAMEAAKAKSKNVAVSAEIDAALKSAAQLKANSKDRAAAADLMENLHAAHYLAERYLEAESMRGGYALRKNPEKDALQDITDSLSSAISKIEQSSPEMKKAAVAGLSGLLLRANAPKKEASKPINRLSFQALPSEAATRFQNIRDDFTATGAVNGDKIKAAVEGTRRFTGGLIISQEKPIEKVLADIEKLSAELQASAAVSDAKFAAAHHEEGHAPEPGNSFTARRGRPPVLSA